MRLNPLLFCCLRFLGLDFKLRLLKVIQWANRLVAEYPSKLSFWRKIHYKLGLFEFDTGRALKCLNCKMAWVVLVHQLVS